MEDCLDSSPETSKSIHYPENCHGEQFQIEEGVTGRNDIGESQCWSSLKNYHADDISMLQYGHYQIPPRKTFDHIKDKELRKKLKNRESAQAARDRKKAKMMFLENRVNQLVERNRFLETKNENLLKYVMSIKARTGLLHQEGEEEMAIYNGQYHPSAVESNRNMALADCNTLQYPNARLDQEVYYGGSIQPEGGNRLGTDLRDPPHFQHGYAQSQDCYGCVPYLPHKYSETTESSCDLRSDSSVDSAIVDCRRSVIEQDDCKNYVSHPGILDLGMRGPGWTQGNGIPGSVIMHGKETPYSFSPDGAEGVLFEPVKEKKIFASTDWESAERPNHDASYQNNARNKNDSVIHSTSSDDCTAAGQEQRYNTQQNDMNIGNPFPEDKFMLEVH